MSEVKGRTLSLERIRDALNEYDESCEDKACECCSAWAGHVVSVIDLIDAHLSAPARVHSPEAVPE